MGSSPSAAPAVVLGKGLIGERESEAWEERKRAEDGKYEKGRGREKVSVCVRERERERREEEKRRR